jgi:hypothetical protein
MKIDGQCHCGLVSYEAEIDPELVSICHCTDCQTLTGSPYRVTVICSAGQVRITGQPPRSTASGVTTAACASSISAPNAVPRCSPAASRAGPTISAFAGAASASATGCHQDGRSGAAPPRPGSTVSRTCRGGRWIDCRDLARHGPGRLNRGRHGRLAQLVRASTRIWAAREKPNKIWGFFTFERVGPGNGPRNPDWIGRLAQR